MEASSEEVSKETEIEIWNITRKHLKDGIIKSGSHQEGVKPRKKNLRKLLDIGLAETLEDIHIDHVEAEMNESYKDIFSQDPSVSIKAIDKAAARRCTACVDDLMQIMEDTGDDLVRNRAALALCDIGEARSLSSLMRVILRSDMTHKEDTIVWSCRFFNCREYLLLFSYLAIRGSYGLCIWCSSVILNSIKYSTINECRYIIDYVNFFVESGDFHHENSSILIDIICEIEDHIEERLTFGYEIENDKMSGA